jgi:hypothetical protein
MSIDKIAYTRKDPKWYMLDTDYVTVLNFNIGRRIHIESITLDQNILVMKKGWKWNGANILVDTQEVIRPSATHDALYTLIEKGKLDKKYMRLIDKQFISDWKEDFGKSNVFCKIKFFIRRNYSYFFLRVADWSGIN